MKRFIYQLTLAILAFSFFFNTTVFAQSDNISTFVDANEKDYPLKFISINLSAPDSVVQAFGFLVANSLAAQKLGNVSLEAIEKGFKDAFKNGDPNSEELKTVNQKIGMYLQSRMSEDAVPIPDSMCEIFGQSYATSLLVQFWDEPDFALIAEQVKANINAPLDSAKTEQAFRLFRSFVSTVVIENIKAKNLEFLKWHKAQKGVVTEESGLQYFILRKGNGKKPQSPMDTVKVHYTGKLINGNVFDSSIERDETLNVGLNQMIEGFAKGVQKMSVGSKWRLVIPQELAYGPNGRPGIPPVSTLIFDIELFDVMPFSKSVEKDKK